jgi:ElaB/YqjD/DUF883 family membrane-anchored ribosome-binding protein
MIALLVSLALTFPPSIDLFGDIRLRTRIVRAGETHVFDVDGAAVELWDYNFLLTDSQTQLTLLSDRIEQIKQEATEIAHAEVFRVTSHLRAENDDLRDVLEMRARQVFDLQQRNARLKKVNGWLSLGSAVAGGLVLGLSLYIVATR